MYRVFFYLSIIILSQNTYSNELTINEKNTWFLPSLIEDNNKMCKGILKDAKNTFLTNKSLAEHYFWSNNSTNVAGMKKVELRNDPDILQEGSNFSTTLAGKKYYFHQIRHHGCGGACEQYQLAVSELSQVDNRSELIDSAPPASARYSLYKDENKKFWYFLFDKENDLLTYQLQENGQWQNTCAISFSPSAMENNRDKTFKNSHIALNNLKTSVKGLTRGAGSCGTMRTHGRWARRFSNLLPVVLYRPWALKEGIGRYRDEYGTYDKDIKGLNTWSLMGLSEKESFRNYIDELENTTKVISSFYIVNLGWSKQQAQKIAKKALSTAVSSTIRFYYYHPLQTEEERLLRQAILKKRPINDIKDILFDFKKYDKDGRESLLSIAVIYPEALKYLIKKGLNPNHENAFGKTPLMYAAQYNLTESAKVLLEAGADSNAKTTRPVDTCNYTLRTFNMTPLHYAVRYASPEFINLLLKYGAMPIIKTEYTNPYVNESPLDWLKKYTQIGFEEKDPNIPDESIEELVMLLNEEKFKKGRSASNYVLDAEKLYRDKKITAAYQKLGLALTLEPTNERALSDMSLIALKNNKYGQSIEAGNILIKNSKSNKLKANAWFNKGLACEKYKSMGNRGTLTYNGKYYCSYGYLYSYFKSVSLYPTTARKKKIVELFDSESRGFCRIEENDIKFNLQMGRDPESSSYSQLQTIFVLHKPNKKITGQDLAWKVKYVNAGDKQITPDKVSTVDLGDLSLSVFNTKKTYVQYPYKVFGHKCDAKSSKALKLYE